MHLGVDVLGMLASLRERGGLVGNVSPNHPQSHCAM